MNSPYSVGSRTAAPRSTSFSCRRRYSMRSATVTIFSPCRSQYGDEVGHAGHRPVLVHDLADDAGRVQPGEPREVDRRLGLADALEHAAAAARAAGRRGRAGRGRRPSSRVDRDLDRAARSAAEMPVVTPSRASIETVNAVPSGASLWSVIGRSAELVGALLGQAEADQAAGVRGHEVDRLGRRELRRDRQVALVLAVLRRRRRRRTGPRGCPRSPPRSSRTASVTAIACKASERAAARRISRARRPRG